MKMGILLEEYAAEYASQVILRQQTAHGRELVSARDFRPGEVLFVEPVVLDTASLQAATYVPLEDVVIARDYQRLLYQYVMHAAQVGGPPANVVRLLGGTLSTDGMTSVLGQRTNAERIEDYTKDVRSFRETVKRRTSRRKTASKKSATCALHINATKISTAVLLPNYSLNRLAGPIPSQEELLRFLFQIETNVHAEEIEVGSVEIPSNLGKHTYDLEEEDHCALSIMSSMPNHSCKPTAVVHFVSAADLETKLAAAPYHYSGSTGSAAIFGDWRPATYLVFTALRSLAAGQPITIEYNESMFFPARTRRAMLEGRGFVCNCCLCAGPERDFARAVVCRECGTFTSPEGYPLTGDEELEERGTDVTGNVVCEACDRVVAERKALRDAEDKLEEDQDALMAIIETVLNFFGNRVLNCTKEHGESTGAGALVYMLGACGEHPGVVDSLSVGAARSTSVSAPLAPSHSFVYDAIRKIVFFDPDAIGPSMLFPATLYLVAANYAALAPAGWRRRVANEDGAIREDQESEMVRHMAWNADVLHNLQQLSSASRTAGADSWSIWAEERLAEVLKIRFLAKNPS